MYLAAGRKLRKTLRAVLPASIRILVHIGVLALALWPADAVAGNAPACGGDCSGDGRVVVSELITAVRINLESTPIDACTAADADASGTVDVSEIVQAVGHALRGCVIEDGAVFIIRACASAEDPDGQVFRALIRDPSVIATAESLIGPGPQLIIAGSLIAGDGGFNGPWSWHLDPDTIAFADFAIELCDGCPMFVEEDLDYWLGTVGQYCPWSTEVLARER
jgi:hypothetical protein